MKPHRAAGSAKGAKQGIRINGGGRPTKLHAAVDGKGRALNFIVTGGEVHAWVWTHSLIQKTGATI